MSASLEESNQVRAYFQTRFKPEPVRDQVWKTITDFLLPILDLPAKSKVLELGTGYGSWIKAVPSNTERHALDLNPDLRAWFDAQGLSGIQTYSQTATNLSNFKDNSFDLILASNLLEHLVLEDALQCAREMFRVLKKGGQVCLIQPNFKICPKSYFDDFTHRTIFTDASLKDMMESKGLKCTRMWKRFVPFSMKGGSGKLAFLLPLYLRSPVKPLAGQMCLILRKDLKRCGMAKQLALFFPAYNEEPNIERAVKEFSALKGFDGKPLIEEVLVVNNNSKDRTHELAEKAGARVVLETNQGYGNALQRGLREARTDLVVLAEPDGTFVAEDIVKLLAYSGDFEMVCGTRTTRELIWEEANMGWFLRVGNVLVAKFFEVLYGTPSLSDCGCTFRLIHKSAIAKIQADLHVGASHFLPNMIIAARMNDVKFVEIPLSYRGRVGESKITGTFKGTWKTGTNMIKLMIRSWPSFMARKRKNKQNAYS